MVAASSASPASPASSTASAATSVAEAAVPQSHLERAKLGLLHDVLALTRSVRTRDPRPTARVLRSLNVVRRRLQPHAKLAALESIPVVGTPSADATNAKASAAPSPSSSSSSSFSSSSSSSATDAATALTALPDTTKEQGFVALVFVLQAVSGKSLSAAASVMSDVDERSAAYTTPVALARLAQSAFAKTASVAALLRLGTDEYEKAVEQQASTDADGEQADVTGADKTGADSVMDAVRHVREAVAQEVVPEVLLYLDLLYALYALDSEGMADDEACTVLSSLVHVLATQVNRRTADTLSAKVYHFYALAYERWSRCTDPARASPLGARVYSSIRPTLLLAHRTACLQHNDPACSVLITSILRSYLHDDLYAQADSFRLKASFPETRESALASSSASASASSSGARTNAKSASGLESSSQLARYLYYTGRIQALQLQYSDAYASLLHALRKAPQSVRVARGFRSQVTKLFIIVQLLMGDIPERSVFAAPDLAADLVPYLALTRAVRVGDLSLFECAQAQYASAFAADHLSSLIVRLRHHVIKTALRQVNLSYSQVRLGDLAVKLKLSSVADAEAILVKAIHDHVVDAVVTPVSTGAADDASALAADLANSIVASEVAPPLYTTTAPQEAFDRRIQFTMEVRNEAVRALRFPDNSHKTINEILEEEEEDDDLSMSSRKRDKEQRKDASSKDGRKDPPAKK